MKINKEIKLHNDAILIDALGGVAGVAKIFGYSNERVTHWRIRGIPARALLDNTRLWARARRLVNGKPVAVVFNND